MMEKLSLIKRLSVALSVARGDTKALTQMNFPVSQLNYPYYDGSVSYSGTNVNYASEVGDLSTSSLVMAAVRWLGNTLPEAPLQVKNNKGGKGESEEVPDHPLVELFRRPNPYYSGSTLWKAYAFSWILSGNTYFVKVWNDRGTKVLQLWYEPHNSIRPRWVNDNLGSYIRGENDDPKEFINYYELDRQGRKVRLERSDVIHFRDGFDPMNGRVGLSPMASILRELFTDNQAAHYSARLFKNMGIIPYVIAPKEGVQVNDDELRAVKASLIRQTTGDKLAEPVALGGAVELLKPPAFDPKQMEIKIARRLPEERFAAVTGIPIQVLGFGAGLERSTYSNMAQAYEGAYESYLIPLHRHIGEELSVQLLPDFEDERSIKDRYVRHDLSKVRALQEDDDNASERVLAELSGGMMSLNQARSMRGLDPVDNGEVYYIPTGVIVTLEAEIGVKPEMPEQLEEPIDQPSQLRLVKALSRIIKPNGHEHEFSKALVCTVCQKSADELIEETNATPPEKEIDAAVDWFDKTVPDAEGLLDAEVDNA